MAQATGAENYYTLKDIAAQRDPNGNAAKVAEILERNNTIFADAPSREGNMDVGERLTMRAKQGTPKWKRYNEHVKPSVSKTTQVDEVTGHLEDWSEIDCDLADKAADGLGDFLLREARPKMAAMADEMATQMIYGSLSNDPKTFNGFMTRLSEKNDQYMNGSPIVLDAGSTQNTGNGSILLVGWGDDTVYSIFPKGSTGGIQFTDKGKVTSENEDGLLDVYRSKFSWDCGLAVKDYRYIARLANIDVAALAALTPDTAKTSDLYFKFMELVGKIPNPSAVNLVAYCSRDVWIAMNKIAMAEGNRSTNTPIPDFRFVANVFNIPVKLQDAMLTSEAKV